MRGGWGGGWAGGGIMKNKIFWVVCIGVPPFMESTKSARVC